MTIYGQFSVRPQKKMPGELVEDKVWTSLELVQAFVENGHAFDPPEDDFPLDLLTCTNCGTIINNWAQLGKFRCPPLPKDANPFAQFHRPR